MEYKSARLVYMVSDYRLHGVIPSTIPHDTIESYMGKFSFSVTHDESHSSARLGEIDTAHGIIHTPAFVPVGTQASVKSLTPEDLENLGVELFFVNTYHAYLRPGTGVIGKFRGLHRFMGWNRSIITDSGGFQVFSLGAKRYVNVAISESAVLDRARFTKKSSRAEAVRDAVYPDDYRPVGELVKIDEEGVTFTSHWDGSEHRFTPEVSIGIQQTLGSDIAIAFDECPPYPTTHAYAAAALARTHRWAGRSLAAHAKYRQGQALYGVIQGSVFEDLRKESAKFISNMQFDGLAIGGVAVGESKAEMQRVLTWVLPFLPRGIPRHLLGVGEIDDIFTLIENGIDTFDCVQPTRLARMGKLFIAEKKNHSVDARELDITKKLYANDTKPVDPACMCYLCTHFSRGYLHHLFRVRELLGYRLATIHNLSFMMRLVSDIRVAIAENRFLEMKKQWHYSK